MVNNKSMARASLILMKASHDEKTAQLRERMQAIMKVKPRSITALSKEIGVSMDLLRYFLMNCRQTNYKSQCILETWIEREEKYIKEAAELGKDLNISADELMRTIKKSLEEAFSGDK